MKRGTWTKIKMRDNCPTCGKRIEVEAPYIFGLRGARDEARSQAREELKRQLELPCLTCIPQAASRKELFWNYPAPSSSAGSPTR